MRTLLVVCLLLTSVIAGRAAESENELINRANTALNARDWPAAEGLFRQLVALAPNNWLYLQGLADAVGGAAGAILTGVFAVEAYGGTAGLLEGNAAQVVNQCVGVAIVFVYDFVVSIVILKIIDIVIGLRVKDEVEREGLDLALHGEAVQ